MEFIILIGVAIASWLILAAIHDVSERLKVLEYEQNRQFNVITERLGMLQSDLDDIGNDTRDISYSLDDLRPPKPKIDPFLSYPPDND